MNLNISKFYKNGVIDLNKIPAYSPFKQNFKFELNKPLMGLMLNSTETIFTPERKQALQKIYDKLNDNMLTCSYSQRYGVGRFYPNNMLSPISISRHMKHTLFTFLDWIDIDMVKGHASILHNVALDNKICLKAFDIYLNNNANTLQQILNFYNNIESEIELTTDHIKDIFNILLYGGTFNTWKKSIEKKNIIIRNEDIIHSFIKDFQTDTHYISEFIYNLNQELLEKVCGTDTINPKGKLLSYYCGILENHIIYITYHFLKKKGIITEHQYALEYDGICFKKPNNEVDYDYIVSELNIEIEKYTNFNVKMKFKDYNPIYVHTNLIEIINGTAQAIPINECEVVGEVLFENSVLDPESISSFDEFKYVFEKTHFKCTQTSSFYQEIYDEEGVFIKLASYTEYALKVSYRQYNYEIETKKGSKTYYYIDEWFNSKNIRCFARIDNIPPTLFCPQNVYNLWKPFRVQTLTDLSKNDDDKFIIPDEEFESLMGGLDMILNHIRIISNHNEAFYIYLLTWIGFLFVCPHLKSIVPVIIGAEGTGKTMLFNFIFDLIGAGKCFKTSTPERDIWGQFNPLMATAYLIVFDEISIKQTQIAEGFIKDITANTDLTINQKGEKPYVVKSYAKFGATTNFQGPFKSKKGDRRFVMTECSPEKKGDFNYFKKLDEYMHNKKIQLLFYEYVTNLDNVAGFNEIPIPTTNYQDIIQQSNKNDTELFFEDFVENCDEEEVIISSKEIFDKYVIWCSDNNFEFIKNNITFSRNLFLLPIPKDSIVSVKHKQIRQNKINITALKTHYGFGCQVIINDTEN